MPDHYNNPILASIDIISAFTLIGWWFDLFAHPVGTISTALAALWYGYCLFDAIEKRIKNKDK